MARLSLWKNGKHSNDYKFFDRRISEMFTLGGTGVLVHKYLGTNSQGLTLSTNTAQNSAGTVLGFANTLSINIGDSVTGTGIQTGTTVVAKDVNTVTLSKPTTSAVSIDVQIGFSSDAAKPAYTNQSEQNIQDLLFMENRDRKYDPDVYTMRGVYQVSDQDFDLSQFGLFLATGTLFMVFHINDMVDTLGRRVMNGDVLELQHLIDYDGLNQDVPAALKRFFVVGDCSRASEGYSPTWFPHLWRCKLNPLVDSQEYKDILNQIITDANGNPIDGVTTSMADLLSTYNKNIDINDAIVKEAEYYVPQSGYDTTPIYHQPLDQNGDIVTVDPLTGDNISIEGSNSANTADQAYISPSAKVQGYITSDGTAPNGFPVTSGIMFPDNPTVGTFALRTDYVPNRLFRYDSRRWVRIEDIQRTGLTPNTDQNKTLFSSFAHNSASFTNSQGQTVQERQSLSKALKPKADN